MRIADGTRQDVASLLRRDGCRVIPFGGTEQHAQLPLCAEAILAEKVAANAAAPPATPVVRAMCRR